MKKELIKNIIKPFFKKHGFTNKGINFHKDLGDFELKAELQSQRYYKEENGENFRINFSLYIKEFIYNSNYPAYYGCLPKESSWVEVSPKADYEQLSLWLTENLEKIYLDVMQMANFQKLKDLHKDVFGVYHLYLIKKVAPETLPNWLKKIENALVENQEKRKQLESKRVFQNQREESLDKEVLLEGISMQLRKVKDREKKLNNLLLMNEKIAFE